MIDRHTIYVQESKTGEWFVYWRGVLLFQRSFKELTELTQMVRNHTGLWEFTIVLDSEEH